MTSANEPERADDDDSGIPDRVRAFLRLVSAVTPVLAEAGAEDKRLDVEADRHEIGVKVVGAMLRELARHGIHLVPQSAEPDAPARADLASLLNEILATPLAPEDVPPHEEVFEDWEGRMHPWLMFLRAHLSEMTAEEALQIGFAYATATTAAEYGDELPAKYHLPRLIDTARRWRGDPGWPGEPPPAGSPEA